MFDLNEWTLLYGTTRGNNMNVLNKKMDSLKLDRSKTTKLEKGSIAKGQRTTTQTMRAETNSQDTSNG